jgi:predicted nucleotidyltransferase
MDERGMAVRREAYREALAEALDQVVAALSRRPEVERVILFGSYAAGRRDLMTDLDLLVVMQSRLDFVTRTARLYQELAAPVDMDLLVYTPEEFEAKRDSGFLRHALATGKVLYEKRAA